MQTLEGLKRRIKTTTSLKDIVSSMKTLSAVSVGQYEKSSRSLEKYVYVIEDALQAILKDITLPDDKNDATDKKIIAIMLGSDQGLVGKFNKVISDYAFNYFKKNNIKKENVSLIVVGRSLSAKVLSAGWDINTLFTMPSSVKMMVNVAKKIILHLNEIVLNPEQKEDFNLASGKYKILVFYNKKIDAVSFVQNMLQIMPVDMNYLRNLKNRKWKTKKIPMYNMDGALLLSSFIRQLLFVNIYRAISDSLAAEHFTRMITMQNAENNIDEHLEEMNLEYQQRRQTEITNELLDVVSGAEVLKSKK